MQRRIREVKNDQSGFTLIELLIVIVILGILAAIVVFAVSAFNKNGQQAACQADFKSVQIADEAFAAKNGGAYATTQAQLLGDASVTPPLPPYLDSWPSNSAYTISLGATSTQGPTLTIPGTTPPKTSTDASACSALAGN
jgi:prepilin-type N-terminal cleavage/methylation domain-containing protein